MADDDNAPTNGRDSEESEAPRAAMLASVVLDPQTNNMTLMVSPAITDRLPFLIQLSQMVAGALAEEYKRKAAASRILRPNMAQIMKNLGGKN